MKKQKKSTMKNKRMKKNKRKVVRDTDLSKEAENELDVTPCKYE